jgi:CubicO group peptidase (beta-lactamase class C family)
MQHQRQSNEFRNIWQYNNNMYTVLSQLPVATTGQNFARYVKQNIFDPLNMTSTTYSYEVANLNGHRAEGMAREGIDYYNGDPWSGIPRNVTYWLSSAVDEDGNSKASFGFSC